MKNEEQLTPFTLTYTAKREELLREALRSWGISKRTLAAVKYGGGRICVNGQEQTVRHVLEVGDSVSVEFPNEERSAGLIAEEGDLRIIYEDAALLVVDKRAGQNTIPSREHPGGSLANEAAHHFAENGIPGTIHVVTRLDRDTSGLVCIAKNRHIHHMLSEQQKAKVMERRYEAVAHGRLIDEQLTIIAPIGRKNTSIIEREVRDDGQYAETHVKRLGENEDFSHLQLELKTGRTHQIRVHLAHIGHPLVGDDLYGGKRTTIARQALHCTELRFIHPVTFEEIQLTSPLRNDMQQLLQTKE